MQEDETVGSSGPGSIESLARCLGCWQCPKSSGWSCTQMSGIPDSSQWSGRTRAWAHSLWTFVTSFLLLASFVFLLSVVSTAPPFPQDSHSFFLVRCKVNVDSNWLKRGQAVTNREQQHFMDTYCRSLRVIPSCLASTCELLDHRVLEEVLW